MSNFKKAHAFTARWEGGLTDHPADPGGITKYGVSLRWLRSLGNALGDVDGDGDIDADDIRALTPEQAAELFRLKFWSALRLDDLPLRPAVCLYDCAVNTGPAQAVRIAQRGYNACVGVYGVKLAVDGKLGPLTRAAVAADTDRLSACLIKERRAFYIELAKNRPDLQVFLKGWLNRVNALETHLQEVA